MQQDLATAVHSYLPEINASEINLDEQSVNQNYISGLNQFTEKVHSWSHAVLDKAKLPTTPHEAKALTTKYKLNSNEGCALHMVIELDSIKKSIAQNDASTAALACMKLADAVWHSSIFRNPSKPQKVAARPTTSTSKPKIKKPVNVVVPPNQDDENITLYQNTINELQGKYPNCNVNALRLLAATRLNISKQELDELDISPK